MAIKAFNSVGGFSVGENASNVILANGDITTSNANLSANLFVTDTANVGNLRTDNLLKANGAPWDFANPAGSNTQVQFNDGNGDFGASANFTFNTSTSLLTVIGNITANNANLGNLLTVNFANISSNLDVSNTANVGSLRTDNLLKANGTPWDFANPAGSNTQIQFNDGNGDFGASANFTFDTATNLLNVTGNITASNANLGNLVTVNYANFTNDIVVQGNIANANNISVNNNISGNTANFSGNVVTHNLTVNLELSGNTANFDGNITSLNANLGNLVVASFANISSNVTSNNVTVNLELAGNTANFSGNVVTHNTTVNLELAGNTANFSGNVVTHNLTVNLELSGNTANFIGNITASNANLGNLVVASFANISSNLYVADTANVGNLRTDNLLYANGQPWDLQEAAGSNNEIQFNEGDNFSASSNFTFNPTSNVLTVNGNANVTGTVLTANINSGTSNLVINANGNTTTFYANGQVNVTANLSASYFIGNGSQLTGISADTSSNLANGTSNVSIPTVDGPIVFSANNVANVMNVSDTGTVIQNTLTVASGDITTESNANLVLDPNGTGLVVIANTSGGATAIELGDPTQGNLVSNAVTLSNSSSVSNAIAQLNTVLGKLVPPAPPTFPASQSIAIQSLSTFRMANYVQTDNTPGANKSVPGGNTVSSVRRASSYTTGNITVAGPGDSGTITAQLNGANAGSRTLTANLDGNGTYSNLVIYNNYDYNTANANIAAGFWSVFSSRVAGTVTEGWNEVYISDSAAGNTNTVSWFYDSSAPGTPAFSSLTISPPGSPSYTYSSTVPHYNNTNQFTLTANVNKLSGNMYPTSDTFVTGTAGGAFAAPAGVTYAAAGVTTPLAQNLYVSSGNASISTTSGIISGFGVSSTGPSLSSNNSYNSNTQAFTATLNANVLYKTGTTSSASVIEEANVFVGSTIGSGSGLAFRIVNPGSGNTPTFTGSEAAFDSQSGTLQTYDSTVVANVLKHDQTNYSTGYLPAGPDLSSGRSGTQYFTFKIVRTSVSKFDIKWTGTIAGLWVALPGSAIDTSSTLNGWLDMSIAYAGSGQPGAGTGGNGSNGASLGGVAPLNSAQTNKSVTATFGTVSSSSTPDNEIYIRIALTSGQSVTALSLQTASN